MTEEITNPEKPDVGTYEKTTEDDGTEIHLEFEVVVHMGSAKIKWTASWAEIEKTGHTDELSRNHGAIMYRGQPRINGQKTRGSKISDETLDALEADLEAMAEYAKAKQETNRKERLQEDLTFTIREVSWKVGHRTKYTKTARVLVPSKSKECQREDETDIVAALKDILGEANGKPLAEAEDEAEQNPFDTLETGTEFTVQDLYGLVDGLEDAVADVEAARDRQQAREELRDEHPELHGVRFDPESVRAGLETAAETDERVEVAHWTDDCNDPSEECNLDHVRAYATPGRNIERERAHTY
jgi:hypothetical protein